MTLRFIIITILVSFLVSYISTWVLHWWLRRREIKRQKTLDAWVARFAAVEPQRCPLPDVELVDGLKKEAIADHNAQVAQDLKLTTYQRKLRTVR